MSFYGPDSAIYGAGKFGTAQYGVVGSFPAIYGSDDAIYGLGTYGTARYGIVDVGKEISGVGSATTLGTLVLTSTSTLSIDSVSAQTSLGTFNIVAVSTGNAIISGVGATTALTAPDVNVGANVTGQQLDSALSSTTQNVSFDIVGTSSATSIGTSVQQLRHFLSGVGGTGAAGSTTETGEDNPIAIGDRDHRREVYVLPQKNRVVYVTSQVA
jgi:hypothetical protein